MISSPGTRAQSPSATGQPASREASENTASYIAGVTLPVCVFCLDEWKQPTSVSPPGPFVPAGAAEPPPRG